MKDRGGRATEQKFCPCGSGNAYLGCCGALLLEENSEAITAEALMRSRYCAYLEGNIDYLLATWHPATRPELIDIETVPAWYDLTIVRSVAGGEKDQKGVVEFIAKAVSGANMVCLHEVSRFVRQEGRWLYLDGDILADLPQPADLKKVGRNAPCPCGSGKKYKRCCGH